MIGYQVLNMRLASACSFFWFLLGELLKAWAVYWRNLKKKNIFLREILPTIGVSWIQLVPQHNKT